MAAESGRPDPPLAQLLFDEPYRFDFFQAVRLLERIYPRRNSIGRDGSTPSSETVRFRSRASISFPPSQIHEIKKGSEEFDEERPPEMMVCFMGLTGPLGVLPHPYTELLMERARHKDTALWDFLDLFTHRTVSLFYRAWERSHFPIAYERGKFDEFTHFLFSFIGMGTRGLRGDRLHLPDQALIFYGGLIAQRPHSASSVEAILRDHFQVPVRLKQFAGQWLKLDPENYTRLGKANSELAVNTVAGTRIWDNQSKFRLSFGPLNYKEFQAFLPVGSAFKAVTALTRFLVGGEMDFDVQPVLKAEEVPACVLGTGAKDGPLLGWTTWLKSRDFEEDASQVVLAVNN